MVREKKQSDWESFQELMNESENAPIEEIQAVENDPVSLPSETEAVNIAVESLVEVSPACEETVAEVVENVGNQVDEAGVETVDNPEISEGVEAPEVVEFVDAVEPVKQDEPAPVDDVQAQVEAQLDALEAAEESEGKRDSVEKKNTKSKCAKRDDRCSKSAQKKRGVDAKTAKALDEALREVNFESRGLDCMEISPKRVRRVVAEAAEKPVAKTKRGRVKPATPEEQAEEAVVFDVISQIQSVAKRKVKDKEDAPELEIASAVEPVEEPQAVEEVAESVECEHNAWSDFFKDAAQDTILFERPVEEKVEEADEEQAEENVEATEAVEETAEKAVEEAVESAEEAVEAPAAGSFLDKLCQAEEMNVDWDPFSVMTEEKLQTIEDVLDDAARKFEEMAEADDEVEEEGSGSATFVEPGEVFETNELEEEEDSNEIEGFAASFWDVDDSIELDWGANAKVEETCEEPKTEVEGTQDDKAQSSSCECCGAKEEAQASEEEPQDDFERLGTIDFDDDANLNAFFAFDSGEEDLGFGGRKANPAPVNTEEKVEQKVEKKAEKAEIKAEKKADKKEKKTEKRACKCGKKAEAEEAAELKAEEPQRERRRDKKAKEGAAEEEARLSRRDRVCDEYEEESRESRRARNERSRGEYEESRESRRNRNDDARDEYDEEPRESRRGRNERSRDEYDEEPRESRRSRSERSRDEYDEEPRESRRSRNERSRDEYDEEPRESRRSRNERSRDEYDEEPRESRRSRNDRVCDEYDEEPRESRRNRNDRVRDEYDEESGESRRARRESPREVEVSERAAEPERPVLPSWAVAVSYVVKANLSKRMDRSFKHK